MDLSFGIQGLEFLNNINVSGIFSTIGQIITFIVIAFIIAAIVGFYFFRKKQTKLYNIQIHFFKEINGQPIPSNDYTAAELIVPNTSIRVFHIKENDTYLPRGTKAMGKNSYWYMLLNNGEIINFTLKNINKELAEANAYYDHTDTRYAHENLKQIIKREYRDKSTKWWKEYKEVISLVIIIFVMTLSFIFIISRVGTIIDKLAPLIAAQTETTAQLKEVLKYIMDIKAGSGVIIK
jgi:hypothetical protein